MFLFHAVANKKNYTSLYQLLVFTNVRICYDQAITMIYKGYVIDKMFDINKKTFLLRLKKRVYRFVASELLLFNSVIHL